MSSWNLGRAARILLTNTIPRDLIGISDSQFSETANYFAQLGIIKACPAPIAGLIGSTVNSTAAVPSRALLSGTNVTSANIGSDATTTSLGVTNGEGWMLDPCSRLTFTADLAANAGLGNGLIVNGMNYNGTTTISGYDWPLRQPNGRPWFHGRSVRARLSYFNNGDASQTMPFRYLLRRVGIGAGATNVGTNYVNVAPSGTTPGFFASGWTEELADPGTLSGSNNNDHELRVVLECNGGNESTAGAFIIPHRVIVQAMESAGVPAKGINFDFSGRAGINADQCLTNRGSLAAWTSRFNATKLGTKAVLISSAGHNIAGGTPDANWSTKLSDWNNRLFDAGEACYGAGNFELVCMLPWMHTASPNGMDSLAKADDAHARVLAIAQANGFGFMSLHYANLRGEAARNDLHLTQSSPATPQNAVQQASLFWQAVATAAAAGASSPTGMGLGIGISIS